MVKRIDDKSQSKAGQDIIKTQKNDAVLSKVYDVARLSRVSFSQQLNSLGLFGGQERIILLLKEKDGLAPGKIAEELGVSAPTIAKSISRLTARGILVRRVDKSDRRRASVHLTNVGHSIVKTIRKAQRKWQKKLLKDISSGDKQILISQLDQILTNISRIS